VQQVPDAEGTGFLTAGHSGTIVRMVENASNAPRHGRGARVADGVADARVRAMATARGISEAEARRILEARAAGAAEGFSRLNLRAEVGVECMSKAVDR
jgi:hypothetical protein